MTATEALAKINELGAQVTAEELGEWMLRQRWFAGKASELGEVSVLDAVSLPGAGDPLVIAIVEIRSPAGTHDLYQLPLGLARAAGAGAARADGAATRSLVAAHGDSVLYDALTEDAQVKRLTGMIAAQATVEGQASSIVFEHDPAAAIAPEPSVRRFAGEQSNSSVVVDERHILKAFRRIEAGINPELEMLTFLSDHGFAHIAAVEGAYRYDGDLLETTLGVMQRFVPDARDGWELVQDALDRGAEHELLTPLADLGAVTGEMHTTLASDTEHPEFAPETPSDEHVALLTATIDEQIERMFVKMPDREELAPLRGRAEELRDRLALLSHTAVGGRLVRCHGDYHLGQALLGPEGWIVLDFEGEPNRPLRERRRKRSPLRDVAGMMRSLSYAAVAGELLHGTPAASPGWEAQARACLLDGYMGEIDQSLLPAGAQAIEKQLAMFELEKLLYELRYELENRPDWLSVPVNGIVRLLQETA
ncbi:MAG: maltokinase N-terminal cap-like domain-containing protein [Solirubrobacteraceae bacterium]